MIATDYAVLPAHPDDATTAATDEPFRTADVTLTATGGPLLDDDFPLSARP